MSRGGPSCLDQTFPPVRQLQPPVEKMPIEKMIVQGAKATSRYRAHMDPEMGEECVFCSKTERRDHLSVKCPHLIALFE